MSTEVSNLRTITLVVLLLAFLALALGQWVSAQWLYDGSFDAAERRDALARVRHAQAIVRDWADFLRRNAGDNATWDDSYDFMLGRDPTLPDRVFSVESHRLLRLSAFAYVGPDGRVAYLREYDQRARRFSDPTQALREAVAPQGVIGSRWRSDGDLSGFVQIADRIYAWGAAPIKRSDGSGTPMGHLVLLSELDDAFLTAASKTLDSSVALAVRPTSGREITAAHVPVTLADITFSVRGDAELEARFCLGALDAVQSLDLTVVTPRVVHATAARASRYFLWSTVLYGAALTALALWFIERRLLRPVQAASEGLVNIGRSGDLSLRLAVPRHNDQIGALVGAANEMLAQLESNREIEAARDVAIAESRLKSEFLARMSHEIRTPMNGVLGMAELLGRTRLSERQRRFLDVIRHSGSALLQVINDILDFSKIAAGRFDLDVAPFDCSALIAETAELLANDAQQKGLELLAVVEPAVPSCAVGDAARLRQAVGNLISNAVKFTEYGKVTVRAAASPAVAQTVRLEVTVSDTGVGIAPEATGRIFDAFEQADTAVTRRFGGTGLGLSIARHLARRMGGDIHVQSELGKGSTFTFTAVLGLAATESAAAIGARRT